MYDTVCEICDYHGLSLQHSREGNNELVIYTMEKE